MLAFLKLWGGLMRIRLETARPYSFAEDGTLMHSGFVRRSLNA